MHTYRFAFTWNIGVNRMNRKKYKILCIIIIKKLNIICFNAILIKQYYVGKMQALNLSNTRPQFSRCKYKISLIIKENIRITGKIHIFKCKLTKNVFKDGL